MTEKQYPPETMHIQTEEFWVPDFKCILLDTQSNVRSIVPFDWDLIPVPPGKTFDQQPFPVAPLILERDGIRYVLYRFDWKGEMLIYRRNDDYEIAIVK